MRTDSRFFYPPITERNVRDGCYLTSVGHTMHPAGRPYPAPGHPGRYRFESSRGRVFPDFGLVLIARGRGVFQVEGGGEEVEVGSGDFFCLTPSRWHRYGPDPGTGWEEFWVCFNGDYPHRLQSCGELPRLPRWVRSRRSGVFARRLRQILEVLGPEAPTTTLGMGLRSLALFTEVAAEAKAPESAEPPSSLCAGAMLRIRENLHRTVDLDAIARDLGVTRRTLERHFRRDAGLSPGEFVIRSRVDRARGLIEKTDMPLKSVAYACGFNSPQQMIYDFHRHTGMAPGRFRAGKAAV